MRLFYLINEPFDGYQTGYRKALSELIKEGVLSDINYYSFLPKFHDNQNWQTTISDIKTKIKLFYPDIILVAHLNKKTPISRSDYEEINSILNKKPIWIYDERDVYGYLRKPLPKSILNFAANCDLVTLVTNGKMMKRFKDAGAKNVLYLPHAFDANFGTEWNPSKKRKYDIIMIANRSRSRIPFKSMPGVKEREELVRKFAAIFGEKFAVFGKGWDGFLGNKGPINFFEQEKVLRQSWLSIGWDHFYKLEGYYSDRLPIALVSGVPHLTYRTPGVDTLFQDKKHIYFFENVEQAVNIAKELLSKDKNELNKIGQTASEFVKNNFSECKRLKKMIEFTKGINND